MSGHSVPVVSDPRFASLHNDPRFARKPKKDGAGSKVKVDSRFSAVLTDARFNDEATSRKRARAAAKQEPGDSKKPRRSTLNEQLYELEEAPTNGEDANASDAEEGNDEEMMEAIAKANEEATGAPVAAGKKSKKGGKRESIEERLERLNRMARGEAESDDEVSDASTSDSDDDEEEAGDDVDAESGELKLSAKDEAELAELNGPDLVIDPDAPDLAPEYQPDGSETKRLAAVNLDWDNLRAVDLLASLRSFTPPGGAIVRVTVFPSEYGLKKMAEEARFGPAGVFSAAATAATGSDSGATGSAAAPVAPAVEVPAGGSRLTGKTGRKPGIRRWGDEEADFDPDRLRAYELNKLKYYYALIECDSVATATGVYASCDGMEFEASSNTMDLRFVPDDVTFTATPRDSADGVPDDYEPPKFFTAALQSSNVELTWDADDPGRKRALAWDKLKEMGGGDAAQGGKKGKKARKGKMRGADKAASASAAAGGSDLLDDDGDERGKLADVRAYLASDSDSDDDEEEGARGSDSDAGSDAGASAGARGKGKMSKAERRVAERARMRALLLGGGKAGGKKKAAKADDSDSDDDGQDGGSVGSGDGDALEITFTPGLDKELAKKRKAKAAEGANEGESTWEAYQRKRKEKKKEKKAARKAGKEGGSGASAAAEAAAAAGIAGDDAGAELLAGDAFFAGTGGKKAGGRRAAVANDEDDDFINSAPLAPAAGKKGGKRSKAGSGEEDVRARAELELLMIGDERDAGSDSEGEGATGAGRNYDLKKLVKAKKAADRVAKKEARRKGGRDAPEPPASAAVAGDAAFAVNASDSRFSAVMSDPTFAIDPTAPQFRNTAGMQELLEARRASKKEGKKGAKQAERALAAEGASASATEAPAHKAPARPMVVTAGVASGGSGGSAQAAQSNSGGVGALAAAVKAKFGGKKQ